MLTWNFEELRDLCRGKSIPEDTISKFSNFAEALHWRYKRAEFHAQQAHKILDKLSALTITSCNDEDYNELVFEYEAYVEACVQSLHSVSDILGQIINLLILYEQFSEDKISLKIVINHMIQNEIAPDILDEINKLFCSYEFCYIQAFCNTIKHRRLIETEFRGEFGKDRRNEEGVVFVEFDYKGVTYPKTWAKDIIDKYREEIFNLVVEVGLKVNDFVR